VESGLKLLPCPFCGGEPAFSGSEPAGYRVQCGSCGIEGGWGDYGYQAASAWNTRTRAPSDAALVEALEAISKGDWLGVQRFAEDSDGDFLLRVIAKMRAVSRVALAAAKGQP